MDEQGGGRPRPRRMHLTQETMTMRQRRTSAQRSRTSGRTRGSSHHGATPRLTMRHRSRRALLAGVSLYALLAAAPQVHASDILRGNTTASPTANVTAAQAAAMQQAQQA